MKANISSEMIQLAQSNNQYRSSIPKESKVKTTTEQDGTIIETFFVEEHEVGKRIYAKEGRLYWEYGLRNGKYHGNYYYFFDDSKVQYHCLYRDGKVHGIVSQWSEKGDLICVSNFIDGSGFDFWCQELDGNVELSEEREYCHGDLNGYVRWWNSEEKLWREETYRDGVKHGIEREWDDDRLVHGYPKYHVDGKEVTEKQYYSIQQESIQLDLPAVNGQDQLPYRKMNPLFLEVRKSLKARNE